MIPPQEHRPGDHTSFFVSCTFLLNRSSLVGNLFHEWLHVVVEALKRTWFFYRNLNSTSASHDSLLWFQEIIESYACFILYLPSEVPLHLQPSSTSFLIEVEPIKFKRNQSSYQRALFSIATSIFIRLSPTFLIISLILHSFFILSR